MACLMTPASLVPEKGRLASEERDGRARVLNRGRCADMWVSPQKKEINNKIIWGRLHSVSKELIIY